MDISIVIKTFLLIFMAELGDKTQLAILSSTAGSESKLSVFTGAALALVVTSVLAVLLGSTINKLVNPRYFQIGAGVLFVVMGVMFIFGK